MKQKFTAIDVSAVLPDLRSKLIGLRLQNIYDVSSKTFLLKFTSPEHKHLLLIESGSRMHTTAFTREKNDTPTTFCAKLRKHVKTRRLVSIEQLGMDRIVDFQLGNVVLTDDKYKIIALLRRVTVDGEAVQTTNVDADKAEEKEQDDVRFAIGETYSFALVKPVLTISLESLTRDLKSMRQDTAESGKKKKDASVRKLLRSAVGYIYGPALIDHVLTIQSIPLLLKITRDELLADEQVLRKLVNGFIEADAIIKDCMANPQKGYILAKRFTINTQEGEQLSYTFEEFHPYPFAHLISEITSDLSLLPYATFDEAIDDFYSKFESQKIVLKQMQAEQSALNKLDSVKKSHQTQLSGFDTARTLSQRRAAAIESNSAIVDNVLEVVRGLLASGMDWTDLWKTVQEEQRRGNYLAKYIVELKLDIGLVTLELSEQLNSEESGSEQEQGESSIKVDIDIYASAHANARIHHASKKLISTKHSKTETIASQVFTLAQQKITTELKKTTLQIPASITKTRVQFWFEKFSWFISDENYLCIAPKDPAQTPQIERYILADDIIVTADYPNAPFVVIKSPHSTPSALLDRAIAKELVLETRSGSGISEPTLAQAAQMSACLSKSWETKSITSASWIKGSQIVSLVPFKFQGLSEPIQQVQLIYGYAVLFEVDAKSVDAHLSDRRPWARGKVFEQGFAEMFGSRCDVAEVSDSEKEEENEKQVEEADVVELAVDVIKSEEEEFPDTQLDEPLSLDTLTLQPPTDKPDNSLPILSPPSKQRGKKSKAKRLEKYKDQDDSDREAMNSLLAPDKGPQPKGKRAKTAAVNAEVLRLKVAESERRKVEKQASQPAKTQTKTTLVKQKYEWSHLDHLTGQPLASDALLGAIIVAGPWQAMQRYTYKVKMIPGSTKRSKASSAAISGFLSQAVKNGCERERELIKSIPESDLIATMLGKVKLM